MNLKRIIGRVLVTIEAKLSNLELVYQRSKFASFGHNSFIGQHCLFTYPNITIGDNVYIGPYCIVQSAHGMITIGNNVMFGPCVHIHGGDHIYSKIGEYMINVKKEVGSDKEVKIEDDVWIGANAIILGGKTEITLGEGCIIGAGSVVKKSIPPYAIAIGNPAKIVKMRFTEEQIIEHKRILNER